MDYEALVKALLQQNKQEVDRGYFAPIAEYDDGSFEFAWPQAALDTADSLMGMVSADASQFSHGDPEVRQAYDDQMSRGALTAALMAGGAGSVAPRPSSSVGIFGNLFGRKKPPPAQRAVATDPAPPTSIERTPAPARQTAAQPAVEMSVPDAFKRAFKDTYASNHYAEVINRLEGAGLTKAQMADIADDALGGKGRYKSKADIIEQLRRRHFQDVLHEERAFVIQTTDNGGAHWRPGDKWSTDVSTRLAEASDSRMASKRDGALSILDTAMSSKKR